VRSTGARSLRRPRIRTALQQDRDRERFVHLQPLKQTRVRYIGRPPSASTATASFALHLQEQNLVIDAALADGKYDGGGTVASDASQGLQDGMGTVGREMDSPTVH
jgi:2-oxoglutarate dehydrogenase C-terminal